MKEKAYPLSYSTTEDEADKLYSLSVELNKSKSQIIREALSDYHKKVADQKYASQVGGIFKIFDNIRITL